MPRARSCSTAPRSASWSTRCRSSPAWRSSSSRSARACSAGGSSKASAARGLHAAAFERFETVEVEAVHQVLELVHAARGSLELHRKALTEDDGVGAAVA